MHRSSVVTRSLMTLLAFCALPLATGCAANAGEDEADGPGERTEAVAEAMGSNLLTNGGFESGWKHWSTTSTYDGGKFTLVTGAGTYARIADSSEDAIARICHEMTPVSAGKKYLFQVRTRLRSGSEAQYMHIVFYHRSDNGGTMPVGSSTYRSMGTGTDWHWASVSLTAPSNANQTMVCIGDVFGNVSAGTFDYDGAGIYPY